MKRQFATTFVVIISSALVAFVLYNWNEQVIPKLPSSPLPTQELAIAHAGGEIKGLPYTNSLDALQHNYNLGFRYFEIDFSWSSDQELVLIHDWDESYDQLFPNHPKHIPSASEFAQLSMVEGLRPLNFAQLLEWLRAHPDAVIVSDIKENNLEGLRYIAQQAPTFLTRIIPQIYASSEYEPVTQLGYSHIIFTLYKSKESNREIAEFASANPLYALTMPPRRATRYGFASRLQQGGLWVYVHTINSLEEWRELHRQGVSGIYTDTLHPAAMIQP